MSENETPEVVKSPGALLADDFYKNDDPAPEVVEPVEEPTEAIIEENDDAPEAGLSEETEQAEETAPDVDDEEGVEVTTVEQLAEHFELDPEWMQELTITQKVNGKEVEVKLADALTTHRKVTAADAYLTDAKVKAKSMLEEISTQQEQLNTAVVTAGTLIQAVESDIEADVQGIDWEKLRHQDPAEYSAKKEEVRERRDKLQKMKEGALAEYQQVSEQMRQQEEAARLARLPQEQEVLVERIPEWANDEVAGKEREELVNYLYSEGFDQAEVEYVSYSGKALAALVKAMRYDKSKGKVDAVKKKVVKIPKVLKPGSNKGEQPSKSKGDDPVSIMYG